MCDRSPLIRDVTQILDKSQYPIPITEDDCVGRIHDVRNLTLNALQYIMFAFIVSYVFYVVFFIY